MWNYYVIEKKWKAKLIVLIVRKSLFQNSRKLNVAVNLAVLN